MLAECYSEQGTTPRSTLRFVAGANTANWAGNAHGGTVMRWIHEAATTCAVLLGPQNVRARYSGGIHFHDPIRTGNLVEVDARAILVTNQDIHISILVRSAPTQHPDKLSLATRCMMIFTTEDGQLPNSIQERTAEDRRLATHAREIIQHRSELTKISDHLLRAPEQI